MKLIITNDGLRGWILNGKTIWCDNRAELNSIGWAHIASRKYPEEFTTFVGEIDFALDTMAKEKHTIAKFGIFGGFIYSEEEKDVA